MRRKQPSCRDRGRESTKFQTDFIQPFLSSKTDRFILKVWIFFSLSILLGIKPTISFELCSLTEESKMEMLNSSFRYPNSLRHPELAVARDFHGVSILDKFSWLDNPTSPDVQAWVDEQNALTTSYLNKLEYSSKMSKRYTAPLYSVSSKIAFIFPHLNFPKMNEERFCCLCDAPLTIAFL